MPDFAREFDRRESVVDYRLMMRLATQREAARIAAMTPEQRAEFEAQKALAAETAKTFAARKAENSYIHRPLNTGWSAAAPGPLSTIGKEFQQIILARDWDALFMYLPRKYWGRYDTLGKYSFKDVNGKRIYIPFSRDDIASYVFSEHYSVQPGYECSDTQRQLGVDANVHGMNRHGKKFRNTDPRHIWPIFPGWGYGGSQRYGCEKPIRSTWVKIRKPVMIAVAIVAAVYLGPMVVDKVGAIGGGAAGGGTSAGAASTTVAAKAAELTTFQKIQAGTKTLLGYVNKARTINAVVHGELPPPPIGIPGTSFKDWAFIVAKQEIEKAAVAKAMELGVEYVQKKMTAKEEAKLRAEIEQMQRELNALVPKNTPMQPMPEVPKEVQDKMLETKNDAASRNNILSFAIPAGLAYLAFSG